MDIHGLNTGADRTYLYIHLHSFFLSPFPYHLLRSPGALVSGGMRPGLLELVVECGWDLDTYAGSHEPTRRGIVFTNTPAELSGANGCILCHLWSNKEWKGRVVSPKLSRRMALSAPK